ncbi:MAG TPA: RNA methyltransferase [Gammaproteobacteria bacterium]
MAFPKVRIVLVEPSHPGNIGAAARAMKNMELNELYLVRPERFPDPEATARASGADDLLESAVICDSLEEALAGCQLVFATSARLRSLTWPQVDARGCGEMIAERSDVARVAVIFGREYAGLTNAEMGRSHYLVHIPVNPDFSSLNLGAAVQVIAYETMMARQRERAASPERDELAPMEDVERFYQHLEETMVQVGFLDPASPKHLMQRLRRLYNRAQLERVEINILRGILTETQKRLAGKK